MLKISRRKFIETLGIYTLGGSIIGNPFAFASVDPLKEFYKDSKDVLLGKLLFGEGRSVSKSEKIAIGFTPLNRVKDGKTYTGTTLEGVILKRSLNAIEKEGKIIKFMVYQYSCFNPKDPNFDKLKKPLAYEPEAWLECLQISKNILRGLYDRHNFGATNYHKKNISPLPEWAEKMKEKFKSNGFEHQFYREG